MLKQINIKDELLAQKLKQESILDQVGAILNANVQLDEDVLYRLQHASIEPLLNVDLLDENEKSNLCTLQQIKTICVKYNLRFLDSTFFKAAFPYEAISKIKAFESKHQIKIKSFKIIAPAEVFQLEDCNKDPLLFAQLADNRYYLIHQWGNDLAWYRGIISYPTKSIYSYFIFMWLPALIIAFGIPFQWLNVAPENELNMRLWLTVHSFIALFFFVIFLGSTAHKNFSDNSWDSKYYNQ
ncbi:MAG TPA: hypothetical protein PK323_14285 [Bacteroidia bacterium]|nr:hypothetical protein [Bacteroidia bacterium]